MASLQRKIPAPLLLAALTAAPAGPSYRSVEVDPAGQLRIELASGNVVRPAMLKGQVAFRDPAISPDSSTIGWLVMYQYPEPPGANYRREPIPGALVLYRSGRIVHMFCTEQVFWDWEFQANGNHVAYSTGPTHGGAAECILRDVDSGKIIARWSVKAGTDPPEWARSLRM